MSKRQAGLTVSMLTSVDMSATQHIAGSSLSVDDDKHFELNYVKKIGGFTNTPTEPTHLMSH